MSPARARMCENARESDQVERPSRTRPLGPMPSGDTMLTGPTPVDGTAAEAVERDLPLMLREVEDGLREFLAAENSRRAPVSYST